MYPYIHIILPSYSVLAFTGAFVTLLFMYFQLDKLGIEFTLFLKLFVVCTVGCVFGSKLLFALTQIPWLIENFSISNLLLLIPQSGYVFYGGLYGVLLAICIYTRNDNDLRNRIFILVAPAIPLFHGFGRIGCLFAGCCYGKILNIPINIGNLVEFTRVPVQLMELFFEFILFVVLIIIGKKRSGSNCLKVYLIAYALFRFVIEFLRGDTVRGIWYGLSTSQWISLLIVSWAVVEGFNRRTEFSKRNEKGDDH